MFHNLAVDIAFLLIKNKLVSIEKRDRYVRVIENVLFSGSLMAFFLIISLFSKEMVNFWAYLIFYIPLRIFTGGYHTEKSESKFAFSLFIYIASVGTVKFFPLLYKNVYWKIAGVLSLILIFSSVSGKKENILSKKLSKNQSKAIVCLLLIADIIVFILCCHYESAIAASEAVFIIASGAIAAAEKIGKYLSDKDN